MTFYDSLVQLKEGESFHLTGLPKYERNFVSAAQMPFASIYLVFCSLLAHPFEPSNITWLPEGLPLKHCSSQQTFSNSKDSSVWHFSGMFPKEILSQVYLSQQNNKCFLVYKLVPWQLAINSLSIVWTKKIEFIFLTSGQTVLPQNIYL